MPTPDSRLASGHPKEIIERLFPDQARYGEDERRRFIILDGHWEVPSIRYRAERGTIPRSRVPK
jgi:hypothetical protein